MEFRFVLRAAAAVSVFLIALSIAAAQEVDLKDLPEAKPLYSGPLFFSKDGRWLREFESIRLLNGEQHEHLRVVTYDTKAKAIAHVLVLGEDSRFLSATTDGRVAVVSFNRDREDAQGYAVRLEVETGRQEKIPSKWFDDDQHPYATISGDGRLIGAYTESGPPEGPRVLRLYDWHTKKPIAKQATGFPAGGFSWGDVTVDGKILFQTNRSGGEVIDPRTGHMLASVSPNTYRSPDGAWDVDFPNPISDSDQDTAITEGRTGTVVGKLEGSGGNNTPAWTWAKGAFCGNTGRFVVARVGVIGVFEIPSGKKIAEFPTKTWQGELGPDVDATASVACSADGKRVAIRSAARLTIHAVP